MNVTGLRNQLAEAGVSAPDRFTRTFIALSASFGLRLRDQEHAFAIVTVALSINSNVHVDPFVLAALVVAKVANPQMYYKVVNGELPLDEFYNLIRVNPVGKKFMDSNYGWAFEATMDVYAGDKNYVTQKSAGIKSSAGADVNTNTYRKWSVMRGLYDEGLQRREFETMVSCIEATRQFH